MKFTKTFITPELAKKYLEANTHNRVLRPARIASYANDIANNKWKPDTAETIKISISGNVLDGQHRLYAIIKAGKGAWFHIATDVPDEVFDVLDTGAVRNACDVFKIDGIKNARVVPSIVAFYFALKNYSTRNRDKDARLTNAQLLVEYYKEEEFWQTTAKKSQSWYHAFAKILSPSTLGGMYSYFYDLHPKDAEDFMNQVATGANIVNSAITMLRQKLLQDFTAARKMPPTLKNALIIKTWNYYRANKQPKLLKFDTEQETFPIAV